MDAHARFFLVATALLAVPVAAFAQEMGSSHVAIGKARTAALFQARSDVSRSCLTSRDREVDIASRAQATIEWGYCAPEGTATL
jgi:hypothetical protein